MLGGLGRLRTNRTLCKRFTFIVVVLMILYMFFIFKPVRISFSNFRPVVRVGPSAPWNRHICLVESSKLNLSARFDDEHLSDAWNTSLGPSTLNPALIQSRLRYRPAMHLTFRRRSTYSTFGHVRHDNSETVWCSVPHQGNHWKNLGGAFKVYVYENVFCTSIRKYQVNTTITNLLSFALRVYT